MLFLICNVILFGVNIRPTRVVVSLVGTLLAVGPSCGGLQHCALRISCIVWRGHNIKDPPNRMIEHGLSRARRPWSIEDDLEDELPLKRRCLEEDQLVINMTNEDYNKEDNLIKANRAERWEEYNQLGGGRRRYIIIEDKEDEYKVGVYDEDNNLGEDKDPMYNLGPRMVPVWDRERRELERI